MTRARLLVCTCTSYEWTVVELLDWLLDKRTHHQTCDLSPEAALRRRTATLIALEERVAWWWPVLAWPVLLFDRVRAAVATLALLLLVIAFSVLISSPKAAAHVSQSPEDDAHEVITVIATTDGGEPGPEMNRTERTDAAARNRTVPPPAESSRTAAPSRATVVEIIRRAAAAYGQDADRMVAVAFCESSHNVLAVGAVGERGLWQFLPTTWKANAARLGYTESDVWDAHASSMVTAEMWSRAQQWQWTCAR